MTSPMFFLSPLAKNSAEIAAVVAMMLATEVESAVAVVTTRATATTALAAAGQTKVGDRQRSPRTLLKRAVRKNDRQGSLKEFHRVQGLIEIEAWRKRTAETPRGFPHPVRNECRKRLKVGIRQSMISASRPCGSLPRPTSSLTVTCIGQTALLPCPDVLFQSPSLWLGISSQHSPFPKPCDAEDANGAKDMVTRWRVHVKTRVGCQSDCVLRVFDWRRHPQI